MSEPVTTREIAKAAGIGTRTSKFVLRDSDDTPYDSRRYDHVLAALSRSDKTPGLSARVHTVAYALRKSMTSARMPALSENRIGSYNPVPALRGSRQNR